MDYMKYIQYIILAINVVAFILMGIDKLKAKRHWWRVPEKTFFILAVFFGATGVWLGMKVFRHKTRHRSFTIGIPLAFILNILCLYFYFAKIY